MDQVRPVYRKYTISRLTDLMSHYHGGFLFRTDKEWVVSLLLPDASKGTTYIETELKHNVFNASALIRNELHNSKTQDGWLNQARITLHRANRLATMLKHTHMHKVEYFCEEAPALYMELTQGSLSELKNEYWLNGKLDDHPFSFTKNFTLRVHHRGYNVETFVLGTRMWHDIAKQLAVATRFLLREKGFAHLNLNPDTILYRFSGDHIHCRITDYANILPNDHTIIHDVQSIPNFAYTLPYEKYPRESHAIVQLISTLFELIFFDLHDKKGFFIGDSKLPLVKYNIWHTIKAAALPPDTTTSSHALRPLRAIYDELQKHTMERYEKNEYGMLALLFMTPLPDDSHQDLTERLNNLLNALCDKFNP
jgi:hypothetical protein